MINFAFLFILTIILIFVSMFIGISDITINKLLEGNITAWNIFLVTRIPRTIALILVGMSMAVSGAVMQLLMRNRFVEPSTVGTSDAASLGFLIVTVTLPSLPIYEKMIFCSFFAFLVTIFFLHIIRCLSFYSIIIIPLIGIMLGSIIRAITTFFAYRYDMLQSLLAWSSGDFSSVISGRYELLWITIPLVFIVYILTNRFTIVGLGEEFTINLGLNYSQTQFFGLIVISVITSLIVVTVGQIPFLGLVVPNIVTLVFGDNMRRTISWILLVGASLILFCDIVGRLVRFPYEIPVGTIMGITGSILFLYLLLRERKSLV